jgi:glucose-6-phosphate 1-epimerase
MADFTPRDLTTETARLTAYDHGAHVAEWSVAGVPVVWVSRRAHYGSEAPIRGGIPVCWPWFAAGRDGTASPSHGFVRVAGWHLAEQTPTELRWRLTEADVRGLPGVDRFPHRFELVHEVELLGGPGSETLEVSCTTLNPGDSPVRVETALHTYLHVGDVQAVQLHGLDGVTYHDKVTGTDRAQRGVVALDSETDRVYHSPGPVTLEDPVLGRTVQVETEGADSTVVWNPWAEKAAGLDDLGDDEWSRMVCVEAAALGDQGVEIPPGQRHCVTQRISVTHTGGRP